MTRSHGKGNHGSGGVGKVGAARNVSNVRHHQLSSSNNNNNNNNNNNKPRNVKAFQSKFKLQHSRFITKSSSSTFRHASPKRNRLDSSRVSFPEQSKRLATLNRRKNGNFVAPLKSKKNPLRLPAVSMTNELMHLYKNMPWYESLDSFHETSSTTTSTTTTINSGKQGKHKRNNQLQPDNANVTDLPTLPTQFFSEQVLIQLTHELHAFAGYVRLQPCEQEARELMIQSISNVAGPLFRKKENLRKIYNNKKTKQQNANRAACGGRDGLGAQQKLEELDRLNDIIYLQVFGSYATPQICSFYSDVDMALWGVVAFEDGDDYNEEHTEKKLQAIPLDNFGENDNVANLENHKQVPQGADTKQQKLEKWRNVLQEMADQQDAQQLLLQQKQDQIGSCTSNHVDPDDLAKGVPESSASRSVVARPNEEQEPIPFFVLDREGDVVDDDQPKENCKLIEIKEMMKDDTAVVVSPVEEPQLETTRTALVPLVIDLIDLSHDEDEKKEEDVAVVDSSCNQEKLCIDLAHEEIENHDSDSETNDSADKLENLVPKRKVHDQPNDERKGVMKTLEDPSFSSSSSSSSSVEEPVRKRPRTTIGSGQDDGSTSVREACAFEVSFHVQQSTNTSACQAAAVGPVGRTRTLVVNALQSLKNVLCKNKMFSNLELRRFARVPIITMESRLGFEGDVAIGGHNGTDTSQFAAALVERYKSFSPVVLFLKILLNQQGLDKPFTGGLGSYKLYVMVCHHLEKHLSLGGSDEPGEVLASFFYRFAQHTSATKSHKVSSECQTSLNKDTEIQCHDGMADFRACHRLDDCVELFSICWSRLSKRLSSQSSFDDNDKNNNANHASCSFLAELVRHGSIRLQRQDAVQRASNYKKYLNEIDSTSSTTTFELSSSSLRFRRLKSTEHDTEMESKHSSLILRRIARSIGNKTTSSTLATATATAPASVSRQVHVALPLKSKQSSSSASTPYSKNKRETDMMDKGDADEEELMRGYGVKRSARGALIPRSRPDVVAREQAKNKGNAFISELIARASKNRKNKKKQSRDKNLQEAIRS